MWVLPHGDNEYMIHIRESSIKYRGLKIGFIKQMERTQIGAPVLIGSKHTNWYFGKVNNIYLSKEKAKEMWGDENHPIILEIESMQKMNGMNLETFNNIFGYSPSFNLRGAMKLSDDKEKSFLEWLKNKT